MYVFKRFCMSFSKCVRPGPWFMTGAGPTAPPAAFMTAMFPGTLMMVAAKDRLQEKSPERGELVGQRTRLRPPANAEGADCCDKSRARPASTSTASTAPPMGYRDGLGWVVRLAKLGLSGGLASGVQIVQQRARSTSEPVAGGCGVKLRC
jgi:hypothetical protein